uniref:MADS-box domain-containing protein n=1 Tax=Kalanchoe fedtschenkoi TaxID=63787 RepID=A0A7N0RIP4_KALFE
MADLIPITPNTINHHEKKTKGRRSIAIKKIEDSSASVVSFCKRRLGLFNKASELSILCGVQIALIIFSHAGKKPYSFGHPSVESLVGQFFAQEKSNANFPSKGNLDLNLTPSKCAMIQKLCAELTQIKDQVKIAEKRGDELNRMRDARKTENWWMKPLNNMNLSELKECKKAMKELEAMIPSSEISLDLAL